MSRFLFASWPFPGHLYPCIAVATALRARGNEVSFYTGPSSQSLVETQGFVVFPFGRVDENYALATVAALERESAAPGWRLARRGAEGFREWLAGSIPAQLADLKPVIRAWQPDVVVVETAVWGPMLVLLEATPAVVAMLTWTLGCMIPGPDAPLLGLGLPPPRTLRARLLARVVGAATDLLARGLRRRVDEIRAGYGLPPMGCSVNAFTARLPLYLVPSVPELDYQRHDLPPSVHYVGPCVWNKPNAAAAPDWLAELPTGRPLVHVTEGTAHFQDPFLLRAAAQGLADQPVQVILTSGPQRDPAALGLNPLAPNVRIERWVSHADLLPRCDAVVTTGGAGTVMAALQEGVPLVVVPTLWDKADNAQRVVEAAVGVRLAPRACTPEGVRAAVWRVLTEPRFRAKAQDLACRLAEAPGPPRAAELLEQLAARQKRVTSPHS